MSHQHHELAAYLAAGGAGQGLFESFEQSTPHMAGDHSCEGKPQGKSWHQHRAQSVVDAAAGQQPPPHRESDHEGGAEHKARQGCQTRDHAVHDDDGPRRPTT